MNLRCGAIGYADVMKKYGVTLKPKRIKHRPVSMDFSEPEGRRAWCAG